MFTKFGLNFPQLALNCNASPPVVQHSITTIGQHWSTGTQIVLRCQDGYIQVGDLSTHCLPNQKWSIIKGHCQSNAIVLILLPYMLLWSSIIYQGIILISAQWASYPNKFSIKNK